MGAFNAKPGFNFKKIEISVNGICAISRSAAHIWNKLWQKKLWHWAQSILSCISANVEHHAPDGLIETRISEYYILLLHGLNAFPTNFIPRICKYFAYNSELNINLHFDLQCHYAIHVCTYIEISKPDSAIHPPNVHPFNAF